MRKKPARNKLNARKRARRERVLRGRAALRREQQHSAPPPKPTSLVTFLFGDKKVTLCSHERLLSSFNPCNIFKLMTPPCESKLLGVTNY